MSATVTCTCGHRWPLDEGFPGGQLPCPACGKAHVVPTPVGVPKSAPGPDPPSRFVRRWLVAPFLLLSLLAGGWAVYRFVWKPTYRVEVLEWYTSDSFFHNDRLAGTVMLNYPREKGDGHRLLVVKARCPLGPDKLEKYALYFAAKRNFGDQVVADHFALLHPDGSRSRPRAVRIARLVEMRSGYVWGELLVVFGANREMIDAGGLRLQNLAFPAVELQPRDRRQPQDQP